MREISLYPSLQVIRWVQQRGNLKSPRPFIKTNIIKNNKGITRKEEVRPHKGRSPCLTYKYVRTGNENTKNMLDYMKWYPCLNSKSVRTRSKSKVNLTQPGNLASNRTQSRINQILSRIQNLTLFLVGCPAPETLLYGRG